jgi:hypothetical protein
MVTQQRLLFEHLHDFGWEKVETPEEPERLLEWWQDEVWTLESIWAPRDCRVYLHFVVDPMWDGPRRKGEGVWAVSASLDPEERGGISLPLGRGWREGLAEFFAGLAELRREWQRRQAG